MFQRIERWAAFARGYNRLRSQKWSKDRSKDQQQHHRRDSWNVSVRKPSVDGAATCAPRFYNLERSRRKAQPEEAKINCCGTFSYQSNSELDSNCLETYRYDHSIYFKTIGDIKTDRKGAGNHDVDRVSISSEELVEWDAGSLTDLLASKAIAEEARNNNHLDNHSVSDDVTTFETRANRATRNAWPIVDLAKLDLNLADTSRLCRSTDPDNRGRREEHLKNNNVDSSEAEPERIRRHGGVRRIMITRTAPKVTRG